jgi:hypothetical protein
MEVIMPFDLFCCYISSMMREFEDPLKPTLSYL